MVANNLFTVPTAAVEEQSAFLAGGGHARIERIVSWGQASPPGFWYDQDEGEWVAVLAGRARLRLLDPDEELDLGPGDWLWLPPHRRHRVEWTEPGVATVWLAVFMKMATPGTSNPDEATSSR